MAQLPTFYQKMTTAAIRLPHHFQATLNTSPEGVSDAALDPTNGIFKFFVRTASLPAMTLSQAEVPYQGLNFRIPTVMQFGPGTISMSVLCDSNMELHKGLLTWKDVYANAKYGGGGKKAIPKSNMRLDLLNQTLDYSGATAVPGDAPTKTYILEGIFPTNIGDLAFTQAPGEPLTFTFDIAYQYWYYEADGDPIGKGG